MHIYFTQYIFEIAQILSYTVLHKRVVTCRTRCTLSVATEHTHFTTIASHIYVPNINLCAARISQTK